MGSTTILVLGLVAGLCLPLAHAQTASTPAGPTFTGSPSNCNKWYVVADGDNDCSTVEKKFDITHDQFIAWNPAVSKDCLTNFWKGQAYCVAVGSSTPPSTTQKTSSSALPGQSTPAGPTFTGSPSNCNRWYVVGDGDSNCGVVESKFGITHDEFIAWNPAVSKDCTTNFWKGQAYCVGLGPKVTGSTTSSSSTTKSSSVTSMTIITPTTPYSTRFPITNQTVLQPSSTASFPPSQTQAGQPSYCSNWHFVEGGDTCQGIAALYATWMSLDDFHAWNPAIGADCSALFVHYWVCVGIRPQTQLSLDYETGTPGANATFVLPPYFSFTPAPAPTTPPNFAIPSPTHGAMAANCKAYWKASSGNTCAQAVAEYPLVTQELFLAWNPVLQGNCNGLWSDTWYCALAYDYNDLPMPAAVSTKPSPVPAGITNQCVSWFRTRGIDTCDLIVTMFGTFSTADFIAWNPSVGADCSDIVREGMYYCVGIPGTPTTRKAAVSAPATTLPPTGGSSAAPGPVQDGIVADCSSYWLVGSQDTCKALASKAGVSEESVKSWNPALKSDCSGIKPDVYVCVGRPAGSGSGGSSSTSAPVSGSSSSVAVSTPTTTTATSSSSASGIPTPLPTQAGMVQGCNSFYYVKEGDGCWAIANAHGIELSDFYKWNPAVNNGGECAGLWPQYWVCVKTV